MTRSTHGFGGIRHCLTESEKPISPQRRRDRREEKRRQLSTKDTKEHEEFNTNSGIHFLISWPFVFLRGSSLLCDLCASAVKNPIRSSGRATGKKPSLLQLPNPNNDRSSIRD